MVFDISDSIIYFDAIDPHYDDYKNGEPACTIRGLTPEELECICQADIRQIDIHRKGDIDNYFRRDVTNIKIADMYRLKDGRTPVVFSWKHPDPADEILSSAIAHYGEPAQVLKCIEESVELALALSCTIVADNQYFKESMVRLTTVLNDAMYISKYEVPSTTSEIKMYTVNSESVKAIVSELADVSITTSQMKKIFTTPEEFEKVKQQKLSRLVERMNGDGDSQ